MTNLGGLPGMPEVVQQQESADLYLPANNRHFLKIRLLGSNTVKNRLSVHTQCLDYDLPCFTVEYFIFPENSGFSPLRGPIGPLSGKYTRRKYTFYAFLNKKRLKGRRIFDG